MKYVFSVLAGLAATFVVGLLLFPIEYIIFDNFFHLYLFSKPPSGEWIDDLVIIISLGIWFLLASTAGGYAAILLIPKKEDFAIFLLILCSFIIGMIVSRGELYSIEGLPVIAVFIAGYVLGGWLGIRRKKKKAKEAKKTVQNF